VAFTTFDRQDPSAAKRLRPKLKQIHCEAIDAQFAILHLHRDVILGSVGTPPSLTSHCDKRGWFQFHAGDLRVSCDLRYVLWLPQCWRRSCESQELLWGGFISVRSLWTMK
jgi:hypothetical protein